MKSRHINGINNRLELLVNELTELAQKASAKQEEFVNQSTSGLQEEFELATNEGEKVKSLLHRIETEDWTEQERELLVEHFDTQKRFALYISEKIQERVNFESQLNDHISDSNISKMKSIMHKRDILETGIRRYYAESADEKNRVLDILYDMIEDIYENSFYDHAMKLG